MEARAVIEKLAKNCAEPWGVFVIAEDLTDDIAEHFAPLARLVDAAEKHEHKFIRRAVCPICAALRAVYEAAGGEK